MFKFVEAFFAAFRTATTARIPFCRTASRASVESASAQAVVSKAAESVRPVEAATMENSTPRSRPLKVSEPHLVAPKARRQSNTQFRLKALSASGVGSQGAPSEKPEDLSLLLDNLDKNV